MISNISSTNLKITIRLHFAGSYATKYFWKKKLGETLIEQIIEFELAPCLSCMYSYF